MVDDNSIDEIARIEARLEELAEAAEQCRKFILASKAAIGIGVAMLFAMLLGLFASTELAIGSIAAVLGGIVSFGSNVSTLRQTMADIATAEALRSNLIDGINPRVVGDRTSARLDALSNNPTLH